MSLGFNNSPLVRFREAGTERGSGLSKLLNAVEGVQRSRTFVPSGESTTRD